MHQHESITLSGISLKLEEFNEFYEKRRAILIDKLNELLGQLCLKGKCIRIEEGSLWKGIIYIKCKLEIGLKMVWVKN